MRQFLLLRALLDKHHLVQACWGRRNSCSQKMKWAHHYLPCSTLSVHRLLLCCHTCWYLWDETAIPLPSGDGEIFHMSLL
ncbi:hypothetical protein FB192DRAFT_1373620 [Mucor lusitanicus]|uniref:Secreted protein n=1 Tax=Mucor circinelloides f. lusitanicus TaxID=29924 RepID=A0A8H4F1K9_MUCCL|nr:hypothetical protein FB192DRAFT_1373620 [Mucor lusitanicus]